MFSSTTKFFILFLALIFVEQAFSQALQYCDPFSYIPCPDFFCPVGFPNCNPNGLCDYQKPKAMINLIAKDKREKLQFEGRCKLTIDSISKLLLVEPFIEEFKMISAMFKWEFIAAKNILFIFAEYNFQDFALIFDDELQCQKAFKILLKKGISVGDRQLIQKRFLPYLIAEISKNNDSTLKLKEILFNWIEKYDRKEREKYIQILKDNNVYDLIYPNIEKQRITRFGKRKAIDISNSNQLFDPEKRPLHSLNKIIESPNFKVFKYLQNGILRTKLFIFPSANDKKYCYEYCWAKSKNCFMCYNCFQRKKRLFAKIIKRNGKEVIQLTGTQHACMPRESKTIIEKPNFEIVTVCRRYTDFKKRLIIFLDSSRKKCYEYHVQGSHTTSYYCIGCMKKEKFLNGAKLFQKEDGSDFVLLNLKSHVCEIRNFNPEYYGEREIVEAENFKLFKEIKDGNDRSKLVIFISEDKTSCYEYFYDCVTKRFYCYGCKSKRKCITAKLFEHENGTNYLKLSNMKHICEPRMYNPEKFGVSKETVSKSNFKIFHFQHKGTSVIRLIVFCETNKNLCYEYCWNGKLKIYLCCSCPFNHQVTATICKNDKMEEYLSLGKIQHICDLRQFEPEKFKDDVILEKSMYCISTKAPTNFSQQKNIFIFTSKEKEFCYKFAYSPAWKCHVCSRCHILKAHVTAALQNEGKENEFIYLNNMQHICEPFKYSMFDESKSIVKARNFQFIDRKLKGKVAQHLILFTNDERTECYDYTFAEQGHQYKCRACKRLKTHVYAKIIKNAENEDCLELCPTQHKCSPMPFIPDDISAKIIKKPNFKLWKEKFRNKMIQKLTTRTNEKNKRRRKNEKRIHKEGGRINDKKKPLVRSFLPPSPFLDLSSAFFRSFFGFLFFDFIICFFLSKKGRQKEGGLNAQKRRRPKKEQKKAEERSKKEEGGRKLLTSCFFLSFISIRLPFLRLLLLFSSVRVFLIQKTKILVIFILIKMERIITDAKNVLSDTKILLQKFFKMKMAKIMLN